MSQERKRLYAIIIITIFSFIIVMGIGNYRARQLAVDLAGERVTNAVANAADSLDEEKIQELILTMDANHPYYEEMRNTLIIYKNEHKLENIYIWYKDEQKVQWFHIVDTKDLDDSAHQPLGTALKSASVAVEKTIRGKVVQGEHHTTSLGTFVSSYQEIKDSQGKTFAVLAADLDAAELTNFLYVTRYAQIGILALTLLLIGAVAILTKKPEND